MQKLFKYFIVFLLVSLTSTSVRAQLRKNTEVGIALSAAQNQNNVAIATKKRHPIGKSQKLLVGYGLRVNMYNGEDRFYVTAPAELTSSRTGPLVFFTDNILENFDTLSTENARHFSLNAAFYVGYQINDKLRIGFNIDALGISFGPLVSASIIASQKPVNDPGIVSAKPTVLNALLISDNDWGMLNSELNINYFINSHWNIGTGLTFLFTEYTTSEPLTYNFNNTRFRQKSLMGNISLNYTLQ